MSSVKLSTQRLFDFGRLRRSAFRLMSGNAIMVVAIVTLLSAAAGVARAQDSDLPQPFLPAQVHPVSTVPSNGDVNPYGVAFVPPGFPAGTAAVGDILVSNFNDKRNLQGTGTTIVDVPAALGTPVTVFFQGKGLLGLSTALNILRKGFVLVGNFPSPDGTCGNARPGSILVINSSGQEVSAIADGVH